MYNCKILLDSISETGKRITTFQLQLPKSNLDIANLLSTRAFSCTWNFRDNLDVIISATEFDNFFKYWSTQDRKEHIGIRRVADLMYEAYHSYDPLSSHNKYYPAQLLKVGEWHCPLVSEEDEKLIKEYILKEYHLTNYQQHSFEEYKKRISVARCAKVSYLTHDGKRDIEKDLELFERLRTSGHWSPFEHVATPYWETLENIRYVPNCSYTKAGKSRNVDINCGNFIGWKQYRKEFADENCTNFRKGN